MKLLSNALGMFLYFPEDKSEYIPAVISLSIFLLAAIFTMRYIVRHSKKQEEKAKQFEKELLSKKKKMQ
ncbi:hypothetical protein IEO70_11685 [Bacillus sp. AGMB 02131]|uniref:Uncharacterized protein n=1 Tax=Peribacillus faecalis TaxID=2772559 RepID=A0A927D058_9BACI|nr:hypothetical protein [Peribacillus faecalis]MBD3109020.1 hypothetical protein [Peribacillus faecalis]